MGDFGEPYIGAEITRLGLPHSRCLHPSLQFSYIRPIATVTALICQSPGTKRNFSKIQCGQLAGRSKGRAMALNFGNYQNNVGTA